MGKFSLLVGRRRSTVLVLVASCILVVTFGGCGGCRRDRNQAKDKQKKKEQEEKPKEPFDTLAVGTLPYDKSLPTHPVKPGHWSAVRVQVRANLFDFAGQASTIPTDRLQSGLRMEMTDDLLRVSRGVALPKGQAKDVELLVYVPRNDSKGIFLRTTLSGNRRGTTDLNMPAVRTMPGHQYYMVVLAAQPDNYVFLKTLPSIAPPRTDWAAEGRNYDYLVVAAEVSGRQVALPTSPMAWTPIAYIVWDDFDPQLLSPMQRQAMLDWLHWGGQLLITAPRSLERLQRSFLEPYLPAQLGAARPMTSDDLVPLNHWLAGVTTSEANRPGLLPRLDSQPPEIHELQLHPEAREVPDGGGLVVERRVGRGRIVVTAFALGARTFANGWLGQDTFFNAFLLRRPGRSYSEGSDLLPHIDWAGLPGIQQDARLNSRLRFFTRDAASAHGANLPLQQAGLSGYQVDQQSGVGGWSDGSRCAELARSALNAAAGIEVPRRALVATMLGVYLVLLVPVNWLVFRLLGRVEWAWGMVPIAAVASTVAVARVAQLDIGFARSRTEIAVLELQPGYPRGHLTRFTALYTSLSTAYRATFDDRFAVASSFPAREETGRFASRQTLSLSHGRQARLQGIQVASNSTGMVHSEAFIDLPDTLSARPVGTGRWELTNRTGLDLHQAAVLWRDPDNRLQWAWLDRLTDGLAGTLTFHAVEGIARLFPEWDRLAEQPGALDIQPILSLAAQPGRLGPGGMLLVGWTDQPIDGAELRPAASQAQFRTIVVAHLQYGPMPAPQPDHNLLQDVPVNLPSDGRYLDFSNPAGPEGPPPGP